MPVRWPAALVRLGLAAALLLAAVPLAPARLLKPRPLLARYAWLDDRDVDWLAARILFFESPDNETDATYCYCWEVVTKHLTYGSPKTGYTFTEFIDHPSAPAPTGRSAAR